MKLILLLSLPLLVAGHPRKNHQCRFLDSIPFFQTPARSSHQAREVEILTEFARFTQSQVPVMLRRFSTYKRMLNRDVEDVLRSLQPRESRELLFRQGTTTEPGTTVVDTTTVAATTEAATTVAATTVAATTVAATTAAAATTTAATEAATTEATTEAVTEAATEPATAAPGESTMAPTDMSDDEIEESIETAIDAIVTAIKDTFEGFKNKPLSIHNLQAIGSGVLKGIKNLLSNFGIDLPSELPDLPEISPPPIGDWSLADWPLVCQAIWWPKDDEHCKQVRCAACSTSMFAAARVCQKTSGHADFRCMRDVLEDGACNYCIGDYLV